MNQISIEQLPDSGYLIAHLESSLIFEPYTVKDGKLFFHGSELIEKEKIKECHYRDREYSLIFRESRGDFIERVLTAEEEQKMNPDLIYEQEMMIKKEYACREDLPEKLLIINRYYFTENDTLALRDYRISCL